MRDDIGHADNEMQTRILQDEILHESADVHDAGDMNVADGRQVLVDAGAGS